MLLVLNKPYGMLSQFTQDCEGQVTLAACGFPPGVYPIGRLDLDSEGLLLLSDEAGLNTRLLDPKTPTRAPTTPRSRVRSPRKRSRGCAEEDSSSRGIVPSPAWRVASTPSIPIAILRSATGRRSRRAGSN